METNVRRIFCFAMFLVISPFMIVSSHAQQVVSFPAFKECRSQAAVTENGITCEVRTDKIQYTKGESVLICFTMTNKGSEPAVMDFSSGRQVDFCVELAGAEVWRASKHAMYIETLTSIELQPGETEEFQEEWPQVNDEGDLVSPCIYEIVGQLTNNGIEYTGKTSVFISDIPCPDCEDEGEMSQEDY